MRLVIADIGPINYLILIGHIDILPELFEKITLPSAVRDELARSKAPLAARQWISAPPSWIEIRQAVHVYDPEMNKLDAGEQDAIDCATTPRSRRGRGDLYRLPCRA